VPHPERYVELRAAAKIRERPLFTLQRNFSELELQAGIGIDNLPSRVNLVPILH